MSHPLAISPLLLLLLASFPTFNLVLALTTVNDSLPGLGPNLTFYGHQDEILRLPGLNFPPNFKHYSGPFAPFWHFANFGCQI